QEFDIGTRQLFEAGGTLITLGAIRGCVLFGHVAASSNVVEATRPISETGGNTIDRPNGRCAARDGNPPFRAPRSPPSRERRVLRGSPEHLSRGRTSTGTIPTGSPGPRDDHRAAVLDKGLRWSPRVA